jgi:hypothetical protein
VTWVAFAVLCFAHIYANYRGVGCVVLSTFNRQRFHIVVDGALGDGPCASTFRAGSAVQGPAQAAQVERMLYWDSVHGPRPAIRLGADIGVLRGDPARAHAALTDPAASELRHRVCAAADRRSVFVFVEDGAGTEDVARAYLHGYLLSREISRPGNEDVDTDIHLHDARAALDAVFDDLWAQAAELGWETGRVMLGDEGSRYSLSS